MIPIPMFSRFRRDFVRILISHVLAFVFSWLLVHYLFLGPLPRIRPDLKDRVKEIPTNVRAFVSNTTHAINMPKILAYIPRISPIFNRQSSGQASGAEGKLELPPPWVFGDTVMVPQPTTSQQDGGQEGGSQGGSKNAPEPTRTPTTVPQPTSWWPGRGSGGSGAGGSGGTGGTGGTGGSGGTGSQTFPTQQPQATRTPTAIPAPTTPVSLAQIEQSVLAEINRRRKGMGLAELRAQNQLTLAARGHSDYMKQSGNFDHKGAGGSLPFDRAKAQKYPGQPYGETIIMGISDPVKVVDAWWNSPGHKKILTATVIREAGIGWSGVYGTALVGY